MLATEARASDNNIGTNVLPLECEHVFHILKVFKNS